MRLPAAILLLAAALHGAGCGRAAQAAAPEPKPAPKTEASPESRLYERLREGAYQSDAALEALQEGRGVAQDLSAGAEGPGKETLLALIRIMDAAGEELATHNEPLDRAEVDRDFAAADDERHRAIEDLENAVRRLRGARDVAQDLLVAAPEVVREPHRLIRESLGEATEAAEGALEAFGG